MLLSCDPLHSWDRERSNTHAKSPRFVRKGFHHPFFLHSAASAITSPPHKAYSLGVFLIKGARFWSRARSRLLAKAAHVSGGKICPEFAPRRSRPHSALPSFVCKHPFAAGHYPSFRPKIHISHCSPRVPRQIEIRLFTATSPRSTQRPVHN